MTPSRAVRDVATHLARSEKHEQVARALHDTVSNEWAAVCYFYASYHIVKASLLVDPVFADLTRLKNIHHLLVPDHRSPDFHQARKHSNDLGVNEVTGLLYDNVGAEYRLLHSASVQVRYHDRLATSLDDCLAHFALIKQEYEAGKLVTSTQ